MLTQVAVLFSFQPPAIKLKFDDYWRENRMPSLDDSMTNNQEALDFMDRVHNWSYLSSPFNGENTNPHCIECELGGETYLIPRECRFFNKNVLEISNYLPLNSQFDFIVMDPPWWNKYIRRINAAKGENGYKMLYNEDIKSIPLEGLIAPQGIVVIWCTNSPSHRAALENEILPKWKLKLLTIWHWMKVTQKGDPICDFQDEGQTGKQPFELIFIAINEDGDPKDWEHLPKEQMVVSVPSVIHSHKFPVFGRFMLN